MEYGSCGDGRIRPSSEGEAERPGPRNSTFLPTTASLHQPRIVRSKFSNSLNFAAISNLKKCTKYHLNAVQYFCRGDVFGLGVSEAPV